MCMQEGTHLENAIHSFKSGLTSVPEAREASDLASENPIPVGKLFIDYLRIVKKFALITSADRKILNRASSILKQKGDRFLSASHMTMEQYESLLGDSQPRLVSYLIKATDPKTEEHKEAISDLSEMMEKGHKLKMEGKTPKDGDPEFDSAIWSHTQIENPKAIEHVVIAHFMERFMSNLVEEKTGNKPEKDSFLNAITDFVILEGLRNDNASHILAVWRTPKSQGGVGWVSEERVEAMKEALKAS